LKYALLLYFDKKTQNKINSLVKRLAKSGDNACNFDTAFPPHITLLIFEKENARGLKKAFENFVEAITKDEVKFASLGVFNPKVLFLSPLPNEYLSRAQSIAHATFSLATTQFDEHYIPNQWMPHASLGVDMQPQDLLTAFQTAQKHFKPFSGKIVRAALTKCCPQRQWLEAALKNTYPNP